jgi:hypothetical protein
LWAVDSMIWAALADSVSDSVAYADSSGVANALNGKADSSVAADSSAFADSAAVAGYADSCRAAAYADSCRAAAFADSARAAAFADSSVASGRVGGMSGADLLDSIAAIDSVGKAGWAGSLQGDDTTAIHVWPGRDSAKVQVGDTGRFTSLRMTGGDSANVLCGDGKARLRSAWNMPQTLTMSTHTHWDLALGGCATLTMTGNDTLLNPTNVVNGTKVQLFLVQDSTGSRLMTWSSHYRFPGDTATTGVATAAPTLTATGYPTFAGDLFEFLCYGDSMLYFCNFVPAVKP